jgi:UDP-N-acetylmuramate--alanine ligase
MIPGVPRRLHFLGVRGQGLSALAGLALDRGHRVTACDRQAEDGRYDLVHRLAERLPVPITVGNSPAHVDGDCDALVVASYVPDDHPEILAARAADLPVLRREELLGRMLAGHRTLAVAGVAGKSTTTAMALHAARRLGLDPFGFVAAYDPNRQGRNYSPGDGRTAIIEACEFRRAFRHFPRDVVVLTNLHWGEHVDCYSTVADMDEAFAAFVSAARRLVVGGDDPAVERLLAPLSAPAVTRVGFGAGNEVRIVDRAARGRAQRARLLAGPMGDATIRLGVPGRHNLMNAAMAAVGLTLWAGREDIGAAVEALADFQTLGRRLEPLAGTTRPALIDDYGHHPVHLHAAAATLRETHPGATIAVYFQPSMFRRTALLRTQYVEALAAFDRVFLDEIVIGTNDRPADLTAVSSDALAAELRRIGVPADVADSQRLLAQWPGCVADVDIVLVCGSRRAGGLARRLAAAGTAAGVGPGAPAGSGTG